MSKRSKIENSTPSPEVFKALSEPNRASMFSWLCRCGCPSSVKEISKCCDVDLSVVSRHLSQLKNAGLLKAEKKGKEVLYSVNSTLLVRQLRKFADLIESCGCQTKTKKGEKKNE